MEKLKGKIPCRIEKRKLNLKEKFKQKNQEESEELIYEYKIRYKYEIRDEQKRIQWLETIKNKNGKLTLEETREFLLTIHDVYYKLGIRHNERNVIPIENMQYASKLFFRNSYVHKPVYLVDVPERPKNYTDFRGELRKYWVRDLKPLWNKYQMDFKKLGIDVKKYNRIEIMEVDRNLIFV